MPSFHPYAGEGSLWQDCARLRSARAEQAWIDERVRAGIGRPQVAVIQYRTPAVIYRRRSADEAAEQDRAARVGCDLLQRGSGGGVVFAGPWMLGVGLLLPAAHPLSRASHVASFRWLGRHWQTALAALGLATRVADAASIAEHNAAAHGAALDWACFAGLSHGELLDAHGRKLLGLAQRRGRWGILLSAGLLLAETPWEILEFVRLGQRPERSAMRQQASPGMASLAPALTVEDLCRCLLDVLQQDLRDAHFDCDDSELEAMT
jgi:lipoate-protein ligase A